jgi:hypothetical protein
MHVSNYGLEVLVNGRPVTEYYKDGKSFIEARDGTEYTLRFRNNSWKRVLAIFSVDGVEVLKGKAAAQAENGYIVDAFSSIEIKGYRIDEETVAAFCFAGGKLSYAVTVGAAKTDPQTGATTYEKTDKNNGVIGVRVFEEATPDHDYKGAFKPLPVATISNLNSSVGLTYTWSHSPISGYSPTPSGDSGDVVAMFSSTTTGCAGTLVSCQTGGLTPFGYTSFCCSTSTPAVISRSGSSLLRSASLNINDALCEGPIRGLAATNSVTPNFDLGTSWGGKVEDKVKEVSFKKAVDHTDLVIYYASRESLTTYGIDFSRTKQIFSWPAAFEDKKQYCKPPPGYNLQKGMTVWRQDGTVRYV